ncbi:uncharacterized protein LOC113206322 isoform X2 [Frankliniella occidentalis]|uniref:Uncharacterized protein LOC113206322 isoform X2 n=1 Tax=Frankliniella occidentalis TaxID=133901 RepID=A0A9C6U768_FRAOC|nr:uncharacterized protein LOC113206322 isoform X2 [Frankliniella occidentalis]
MPDARSRPQAYSASPESLPNNFKLIQCQGDARLSRPWCMSCTTKAGPRCWDDERDEHEVINIKAAMKRSLPAGELEQAAGQLQSVQRQLQDKETQHALTLLAKESWSVTLRGGDRILTGTLRNTKDPVDPLNKALCLLLAARTALTEADGPKDGKEAGSKTQQHIPTQQYIPTQQHLPYEQVIMPQRRRAPLLRMRTEM